MAVDLTSLLMPCNASEFWAAVSAFATAAAVVVALIAVFLPMLIEKSKRPVLTVEPELNAQNFQLIGPDWHLRLWIANAPGKEAAETVQVLASALTTIAGDFESEGAPLPQNLRWTHVALGGSTFLERINPGMGRHCELGAFLQRPGQPAALALALESGPLVLPVGVYRLDLKLTGSNTGAATTTIEIAVKGLWIKDRDVMLRERVSLRVV